MAICTFISYFECLRDHALAQNVMLELEQMGIQSFMDGKISKWNGETSKQFDPNFNACAVIIIILSKDSLNSGGWTTFEVGEAAIMGKKVFLLLGEVDLTLPRFFQAYEPVKSINKIKVFFKHLLQNNSLRN